MQNQLHPKFSVKSQFQTYQDVPNWHSRKIHLLDRLNVSRLNRIS